MSDNKKIENPSPEIKDEELNKVAGGIQATVIHSFDVSHEFVPQQQPKETEEQRHRRLMQEIEGSSFL